MKTVRKDRDSFRLDILERVENVSVSNKMKYYRVYLFYVTMLYCVEYDISSLLIMQYILWLHLYL